MAEVSINQAGCEEMFRDPAGPVAAILEKLSYEVEAVAKTLMLIPGSGRVYGPGSYFLNRGGKIYHWTRTTTHQASAPGEPASSDSGYMLNQIQHSVIEEATLEGRVIANTEYAVWVEMGTVYMEPRPFLRPALSAVV